jgi:apolipoprotein D and lipocalin family protein
MIHHYLKKHIQFYFAFLFMLTTNIQAQTLETVPYVDLSKYAGKWFEIASYPQPFQKGCLYTTAEYSLSDKEFVIVENRCYRDSLNGEKSYIKGKAFVVKGTGNAKLKVQFFWPFRGKYWIIDLADDYSYAVVSHPNQEYLWILSRTAIIDESVYNEIKSRLKEKGFDLSKLQITQQQ